MGNPVRKLRETLGLSQVAFGELIGRSHQSVRNYEGKITLTREVIEKLKTVAVERGHPEIAMELSNPVEPPKNTSQKSQKNSERNERWHRLLEYVLNSGVAVAIEAVTWNLEAFVLTVQVIRGEMDGTLESDAAAVIPEDIASRITELRGLAEQPASHQKVLRSKKPGVA